MSHQSPFSTLEATFRLLCEGPSPLAVDGRHLGPPLPRRPIPLTELGGLLLHPATPYTVRDRTARLLVFQARRHGGDWTVGLAGVLLPGLRAAIADLAKAHPEEAADLEAEVLAELLAVLPEFDAGGERVAPRLLWRAAQRARRRTVHDRAASAGRVSEPPPTEPHRPWGHPDFVIAEAVQAGVLTPFEAEMIGETRLGGVSVEAWSARVGWQTSSVRKERSKAERRLVRWITAKKFTRETSQNASFRSAGRSPVVDRAEPARVALTTAGTAREVSPLARRLPATGAACPGLEGSDRRSA